MWAFSLEFFLGPLAFLYSCQGPRAAVSKRAWKLATQLKH